ncbi:MAG: endonuclease III [Epulopiscium sp. Nele67-Bin002]|nr:MAG: endonuclease III [Epulopiscium sp. Nuni2H_MBin001]OON91808.1 MAG: endonuclease III [Epulopiscium sp. Nele67-Bin002]OON92907.1 MAG: endonuclease III [Epulopiscium sp. Nele67-Bin001]
MDYKEHIKIILNTLDENYEKEVPCFLNHTTPFQLLVATILSAQCTDDRVNLVTPDLFEKYPDVESMAKANLEELEYQIKSTGFYKNKAKNILTSSKMIIEKFKGEVPADIESLTSLAGVGRKTANVIRGNIYGIPSIVVDTHVKRISIRWGLTSSTDPVIIEHDLMKILPEQHWIRYNTQVITHGREICTARSPKCGKCMFITNCPFGLLKLIDNMPDMVKACIDKGHMY